MSELEIDYLKGFPSNGFHLQVVFNPNLPILIIKGGEKIQWDRRGIEQYTSTELWCVSYDREKLKVSDEEYFKTIKQFRNIEKAISYGIKLYRGKLIKPLEIKKILREKDYYNIYGL